MVDSIDPALARKLDAFSVPPLPADFADTVLARAMALPAASSFEPLPKLRRTARARWLRGGVAGFGFVAAGLMSVAAAASGWFGEPIREAVERAPVIGAVIERVIAKPKPTEAALVKQAPTTPEPAQEAASLEPEATGGANRLEDRRELRRSVVEKLTDDPRERAWLEAHPRAAARKLRGELRRDPELRAKVRQLREEWRAERGLPPLPAARHRLVAPGETAGAEVEASAPDARNERIRQRQERREKRMEKFEQARQAPGPEVVETVSQGVPARALQDVAPQPAAPPVVERDTGPSPHEAAGPSETARRLRRARIRALRARAKAGAQ